MPTPLNEACKTQTTICFVANYYKTIFFYEIAKRLEGRGVQVVWISPGRRWAEWLQQQGVPIGRILALANYGKEWASATPLSCAERGELASLEANGISDTIYNIVARDRLLRQKPLPYALRYMLVSARQIDKFLRLHNVRQVFGEKTWAHELLISMVAARIGVSDLSPHTIRIPSDRFAFFRGQHQSQLVEFRELSGDDLTAADLILERLDTQEIKPHYFYLNQGLPPLRRHWMAEFVRALRRRSGVRYDETLPGIISRIAERLGAYVKGAMVALARPFDNITPTGKFILIALHKQPEASIDVLAARCSDQLECIRVISRSVPVTHEIWVKEHSNAIGDRSLAWYRKLRAIPGVRLIEPYADTFYLMAQADLVISASGTVCMEAGLLGIPAITFADMFFKPVLAGNGIDPYSMTQEKLIALFGRQRIGINEESRNFLAWLQAQSFEGRIGDPVHDPECMSSDNLDQVEKAFMTVVSPDGCCE